MSKTEYAVCHFTEEGHDILRSNEAVRWAVDQFWDTETPEYTVVGRSVGAGRYASVQLIGGVLMKVSSPTSSELFDDHGALIEPEDLVGQYTFLQRLGEHLLQRDCSIVTPAQYFAMRSDHQTYMLGQQYMEGWLPLERWAEKYYGTDVDQFNALANELKQRIRLAVEGTDFLDGLNDLGLNKPRIHSGNILTPQDSQPGADMRLCIIDQPGLRHSQKKPMQAKM